MNNYINKVDTESYKIFNSHKLPKIYNFAGIESKNLIFSTDMLKRAMNFSDYNKSEIKDILDNIVNPIALSKVPTEDNYNNLIAYTNNFKDDKPVILSFSYNKAKTSLELSSIEQLNERKLDETKGNIFYINNNRFDEWLGISKGKLPTLELNINNPEIKTFTEYSALYNHPFELINAKNDDKHLTNAQRIDIENTRNEIVDPILNGTENGLWAAFKDFKEYGVFDISGKTIDTRHGQITDKGMQQLYAAMEIYRNKKFESFRYLFVDKNNGEIIDQLSVTAHLPSCCPVSVMKGDVAENVDEVIERAKEKDCQIIIAHNHPSGNPEPSPEDKDITVELQRTFDNRVGDNTFLGHIILDHDKFSYFTPYESWRMYNTKEVTEDRFVKEDTPIWFKSQLKDTTALIRAANEVNDMNNWNDNFIPVIFANAELRVNAMKLYKTDFFMNHNFESLHNKLQMDAFNLGSTTVFPIVTNATWNKLSPTAQFGLEIQLKNSIKKNCFTDAAIPGATIANKHNIKCGKYYAEPTRTDKIEVKSTWNKTINPKLFEPERNNERRRTLEVER